jgi:glycosyltransferase involved in cell wall biosynthesis
VRDSEEVNILLLVVAVATLVLTLAAAIEISLGARKLAHLADIPPLPGDVAPRVSVVIPACNEERGIAEALQSVLSQDYPDFEVIAIDDRSTDRTGAILESEAARNPALRVIHLRALPAGWLGKNHALQKGAEAASGSLILFTDADVVMEPSVLRRAAFYMESNRLDHLAIAPRASVPGFLSNAFLAVFATMFALYTKPWKVSDPKSRHHIGIGAFNLVRAEAWRKAGGHAPIAMRPDDDLSLGKLLKLHGFRPDFLLGTELLTVEWYHSFAEMRRGLMKNLFSAAGYSIPAVLLGCVFQLVFLVWPFVAVFATRGLPRDVNLAVVAALWMAFALNAGNMGIRRWWCLALPAGSLIGIYLMLRAMAMNLADGGIEWRGTRYSLAELRANRL